MMHRPEIDPRDIEHDDALETTSETEFEQIDCAFSFDMMEWPAPPTVVDPFGADPLANS